VKPAVSKAAGYSARPLARKLGIKPGTPIVVLNAPPNFSRLLSPLPEAATVRRVLAPGAAYIHLFARTQRQLKSTIAATKDALAKDGMLWISWPKGSSGVESDLNENVVREIGLTHGLVDVKVCAIDPTWSGLKFVYRLRDR